METLTATHMEALVPVGIGSYVKSYGEFLQSELFQPELRLSDLRSFLMGSFDTNFVSSVPGRVTPGATALGFKAAEGSVASRTFDPSVNAEHFTVVRFPANVITSLGTWLVPSLSFYLIHCLHR